MDLSPAKEFGDLIVMLPSGMNFHASAQVLAKLKEHLEDFGPDDYFLPLGDPLVMAAASAVLGAQVPSFKMLKWDRRNSCYRSYDVDLLSL